jgi:hypothetical protein
VTKITLMVQNGVVVKMEPKEEDEPGARARGPEQEVEGATRCGGLVHLQWYSCHFLMVARVVAPLRCG